MIESANCCAVVGCLTSPEQLITVAGRLPGTIGAPVDRLTMTVSVCGEHAHLLRHGLEETHVE